MTLLFFLIFVNQNLIYLDVNNFLILFIKIYVI